MKWFATRTGLAQLAVAGTGLLACLLATGCQVDVGGQTLPSPFFMTDDVQYFPAGPEFKLSREAAAIQEAKARELRRKAGLPSAPIAVPAPAGAAAPPAPAPGLGVPGIAPAPEAPGVAPPGQIPVPGGVQPAPGGPIPPGRGIEAEPAAPAADEVVDPFAEER